MASLVLKMSVSLDGYAAPIDGSTDWIAGEGSDDALSRDREQRRRAPHGCHHLRGDGRLVSRLEFGSGAVATRYEPREGSHRAR
jgi:hypothetical protein